MRPSPRPPPLGAHRFPSPSPSPPSSEWSCTGSRSPCSAAQDLSPLTPEPYFSTAPAIVTPDDCILQPDDAARGSPHKPSLPKTDPCFLSEDDICKAQVFLRNRDRWENMHDRFEGSPPHRPRNASRVAPVSQGSAGDAFSWEATHSALLDPNELSDPSRCSLLIREVSLLVGLAADDGHPSPGDGCPLPDGARQVPDILPLNLTPTKSLASRRRANAGLSCPAKADVKVHPSSVPVCPTVGSHADDPSLHNEKPLPVSSRDLVTPITPRKNTSSIRPSLPPSRRQGQVFHFEPPPNAHHRNAIDLDEKFSHPREPPPKPASRVSSLDRLECSLRKLEAHAPGNHRKSQSEGRPLDQFAHRKVNHPPPPLPQHLKRQRSAHETMRRNLSRPAIDCHFSGLPPRPTPPYQYAVPQTCSVVPLDEHQERDHIPSSFMDMDIPPAEGASQKRQVSFCQVTTKEKMKSLVSVARRVSRGVIAWGKNLAGSTKPSVARQEAIAVQSAHV